MLKYLTDKIFYLPASSDPLSADVFFIDTDRCVYVYDVGSCVAAREEIEKITKDKIIVLSHFHTDHTSNLNYLMYQTLYAGRETLKHIGAGNIVDRKIILEPSFSIRLLPLTSSHAKDCVALCYGEEYAFCGDALYATGKKFPAGGDCMGKEAPAKEEEYIIKQVYNAQKLKAMIDTLKGIDVKYLVISHQQNPVYPKNEVIRSLELIYQRRERDSAWIFL